MNWDMIPLAMRSKGERRPLVGIGDPREGLVRVPADLLVRGQRFLQHGAGQRQHVRLLHVQGGLLAHVGRGIEAGPGDTRLVKTDCGDFETSMVALNLNAFSASLHPWFADKIYPTRGQCLMMERVPRFMDAPCYANFYLDYFRQMPSGELLIGGFRQVGVLSGGIGFGAAHIGVSQVAPYYVLIGVHFAGLGEAVDGGVPLVSGRGGFAGVKGVIEGLVLGHRGDLFFELLFVFCFLRGGECASAFVYRGRAGGFG